MKNLQNEYQITSYQINSKVLKGIKNLNLSINEFLLLIYFLNKKTSLDLEDIKTSVNLTEEEVLTAYSELLTKGIIEIKVEKINGKVNENISLDMFYNKLILGTNEKEDKKTDIYSKFEDNFGRSLNPIEYERINSWINNGVSEELIESALKEAIMCGSPNLKYIDKIIYEWTKRKTKTDEEEYEELFDCDWIGALNE